LTIQVGQPTTANIFRIDPLWVQDEEFNRLVPIWWQEYLLDDNVG
jgi:hypothetical protein